MTALTTILVAVAAAGIVTVGFSWVFASRWGRLVRRVSDATPADHDLPYVTAGFTSHGIALNGWLVKPATARFSTVVVPHGWGSNAASMLPLAKVLHAEGFGVLLYDTRGHGRSGTHDHVTIRTFTEDLLAAVHHLSQRPDINPTRIGVLGHSMGGAAAIVAASTESRIGAVVSSSAFADIDDLIRRTLRRLHIPQWPVLLLVRRFVERHLHTSTDDLSPGNRIGRINVPILLIHGIDDELIPATDLDALYTAANPATTERVLLPHGGHRNLLSDPNYSTRILEFLHRSFNSSHSAALAATRRNHG